MNDKQQLAAMGEYRLTEEQAKLLAERMPQSGVLQILDVEPLCMAKRIEELEAQVRVMAGLLREARPYMDNRGGAGVKGYTQLAKEIDAALAGKLPEPVMQEGWQLVPVEPTERMISESIDAGRFDEDDAVFFWASMIAAAPSPGSTK